jgi:hypothetical protein
MMLLERWLVAVMLGAVLVSTAGAPGQSQASPPPQNTQQTPDTDDAEPAEFHPPKVLGQQSDPPPVEESQPPAQPVAAKQPPPPPSPPPPPDPPLSKDPAERQLQLDSLHLLQLTEDLKAEVDRAGSDMLSLSALRKADEVQKLARSLKERMRDRGQVSQNKPQ